MKENENDLLESNLIILCNILISSTVKKSQLN